MRLWWVSMSLFMELAGIPHWEMRLGRSAGSVVASCTSSTSSSSWKRDMVDSLVRSISTSIQLSMLSMEEVFSMSKWSDRVSRRPPCSRNVVSIVGSDVVVVVYLLLGQSRE